MCENYNQLITLQGYNFQQINVQNDFNLFAYLAKMIARHHLCDRKVFSLLLNCQIMSQQVFK